MDNKFSSPEGLNALSHVGGILGLFSLWLGWKYPELLYWSGGIGAAAIVLLWFLRHVSHKRNSALREQIRTLGGSVGELGAKVTKQRPESNVSAGITGQSELATMTYARLIEKMRDDGFLPSETKR